MSDLNLRQLRRMIRESIVREKGGFPLEKYNDEPYDDDDESSFGEPYDDDDESSSSGEIANKIDGDEDQEEIYMADSDVDSIKTNAIAIDKLIKNYEDLPAWVQTKITLASDYLESVSKYLKNDTHETDEDEEYNDDDESSDYFYEE